MSFNLIAYGSKSGPGTISLGDTTGAKVIVCHGTVDNTAPSDNYFNTFLPMQGAGPSKFWVCLSPTVGAGHVITNPGANFSPLAVEAWGATNPISLYATSLGTGTNTAQPGSIPAPSSQLFITGFGTYSTTGTPSVDSSFTQSAALGFISSTSYGTGLAHKISSSAENPTWTWSGAGNASMLAFTELTNFAAAVQGSTASYTAVSGGSSLWGAISKIIDGLRRASTPSTGGFGYYYSHGSGPLTIDIDFGASRDIKGVSVFWAGDYPSTRTDEPTLTETSTSAPDSYKIQYWTGSAWADCSGASITGNTKTVTAFVFSTVSTSKIRLYLSTGFVSGGFDYWELMEVEAWGTPAAVPPPTITTTSPLSDVPEGASATKTISATGGTGSITWSKTSGTASLSVDSSTGVISDSDATAGSRTITVRATDSLGAYAEATFTWNVVAFESPFGDELKLTGLEISSVELAVERLRCDFGQGYRASATVGSGSGLWGWELGAEVLTDAEDYNDLINGLPSFEYYEKFYRDHTEGTSSEIFWIDFRGKKYHASFADDTAAGEMLTYDLFSLSGVKLKMCRIPGTIYNDDGSIFEPAAWIRSDAITGKADSDSMVGSWADYNGGTAWTVTSDGTTPTYETNEVNGLPCVRLTNGEVLLAEELNVYDIFLVMKVREATFSAARGVISDSGTDFLAGSNGTTKFADPSDTAAEYRLNGTLYANSNRQAPMNAWGIVHLRKTSGTFDNADFIKIGQSTGGVAGKMDLAEAIVCTTQLSDAMFARVTNSLKRRYAIS